MEGCLLLDSVEVEEVCPQWKLVPLDAVASWTNWLMIKENHDWSSGCKEIQAVMSVIEAVWDPGVDVAGRVEAAGTGVLGGMDNSVVMGSDIFVDEEGAVEI